MKRKQPDDEKQVDVLHRDGPLRDQPIVNEYEHLDDGDDDDDLDEDGAPRSTRLRKDEYDEIMRAQEPSTINKDGDIKFTPFNLTEELEDGDFDKSGNFIFRKKGDDEDDVEGGNDSWADTVDWAEVERREQDNKQVNNRDAEHNQEETETTTTLRDEYTCYREMLRIMRSDETVQKAIRRLGNSIPRRRPFNRNARKKEQAKLQEGQLDDTKTVEDNKRRLDLMIELADQRFRDGDMDIYGKSYEDLEEEINR